MSQNPDVTLFHTFQDKRWSLSAEQTQLVHRACDAAHNVAALHGEFLERLVICSGVADHIASVFESLQDKFIDSYTVFQSLSQTVTYVLQVSVFLVRLVILSACR
jgi:hypothetical protein